VRTVSKYESKSIRVSKDMSEEGCEWGSEGASNQREVELNALLEQIQSRGAVETCMSKGYAGHEYTSS